MLVTYIINTWNRKEALRRHLDMLITQTWPKWFQVIVCVDGSTDGTQQMLSGMRNNWHFTLEWYDTKNTEESTAAASRNMGVKAIKGDIVIMADDDCLPHPMLIEKYVNNLKNREVQLGYKSNHEYYLSLPLPAPIEEGGMTTWWDDWQAKKFSHFQTTNCAMPAWAARTPAKDGSIGFDERFIGYGHEDTEFGRRLHKSGYRFVFNRDAVSWHMNPSLVTQQEPERKQRERDNTSVLLQQIAKEPWTTVYPGYRYITGMMSATELQWLYQTATKMQSVAELGSWQGRSTHALLSGCRGTIYAIDHWDPNYIGIPGLSEKIIEDNWRAFNQNLEGFTNLQVLKMPSLKAVQAFQDKSVDMVFIDADHAYGSVMADIKAWLPKTVKMVSGHDFEPIQHPGVVKAVNEVFGPVGHVDTIWFKEL